MHGLINLSIQSFVQDTCGEDAWAEVVQVAGFDFVEFEAMLTYEDTITPRLLETVAKVVSRPMDELLEDIGTYLVSHPNTESLRRLLRFGGVDFVDFLHSLDDLPGRARLAVPDLDIPRMALREHAPGRFSLVCNSPIAGFGHVMSGIMRVMADDYGALVFLEHQGSSAQGETVSISLLEHAFTEGREFDLGARAG